MKAFTTVYWVTMVQGNGVGSSVFFTMVFILWGAYFIVISYVLDLF